MGDNLVFICIVIDVGYGVGKLISKIIEEQVDLWLFFFYNIDVFVKYIEGQYKYVVDLV